VKGLGVGCSDWEEKDIRRVDVGISIL
jgi:hypothetical protein